MNVCIALNLVAEIIAFLNPLVCLYLYEKKLLRDSQEDIHHIYVTVLLV